MNDTRHEFDLGTAEATAYTPSQTYLRAVARIEDEKRERERIGYASMAVASAMGGGYDRKGAMAVAATWAQRFCILFAFSAPSILMILYVL
ncbi:MAG: hypothetical protein EP307_02875 [Rhodobacteraceae bacterium]|nr:MAG: hypothetical protein EP307_02875 [Paracoccaceae bacterium]